MNTRYFWNEYKCYTRFLAKTLHLWHEFLWCLHSQSPYFLNSGGECTVIVFFAFYALSFIDPKLNPTSGRLRVLCETLRTPCSNCRCSPDIAPCSHTTYLEECEDCSQLLCLVRTLLDSVKMNQLRQRHRLEPRSICFGLPRLLCLLPALLVLFFHRHPCVSSNLGNQLKFLGRSACDWLCSVKNSIKRFNAQFEARSKILLRH